ncbi:hypothetical protein KZX37_14245 [Microbacterium sp. EYE_5]|uniref:hypothetical protein n=1 Tax=unclassified Microbacterium TaxID=2609290 RepID=UPI002005DC65|nr:MULTISPECIES: hypothetical protein [unclassified Microbacterium]MCK6081774.1 hypothetical protein [Microbacterium sp. EYE_382]MCK6087044.1 hypothetical protein [Microbacterium sp. EYE_384]MCK6124978.1 hypothetical protein [Microbacterium sp. EYE_80]MCK6127807.1 hypothetical protein [Microbacterium sp. EYE_79]MCK6142728.1 hypothetical protein [Microbacterium sp. EYE_39]
MPTRSQLADFTRGIVGRFTSRNNDIDGQWGIGVIVEAIHHAGQSEATYDFVSAAEPFIRDQADWLRTRVRDERIPESWIESCTLRIAIERNVTPRGESHTRAAWAAGTAVHRATVTAAIADNRGRTWSTFEDVWCWDASDHQLQSAHDRDAEGWLSRVLAAFQRKPRV